jgi:hypothetical protein
MYQVHKSILRKQRDSSSLGLPAHCFVSFFAIVLHEIRHKPPSLHCHTTKTIIHYNKYITLHINLSNKHHLRKACPTTPHRGSTPLMIAIRLLHRPKRLSETYMTPDHYSFGPELELSYTYLQCDLLHSVHCTKCICTSILQIQRPVPQIVVNFPQ